MQISHFVYIFKHYLIVLYNIRYRFSVHSWWPRVLWQAVTLGLVYSNAIRALSYSRCVTGRRSRDENHTVRFGRGQRIAVDWGTRSRAVASLTNLQELAAPGSWKNLWEEEVLYLSKFMSLHPSLTHQRNINRFENKVRDIFSWKNVFVCS